MKAAGRRYARLLNKRPIGLVLAHRVIRVAEVSRVYTVSSGI